MEDLRNAGQQENIHQASNLQQNIENILAMEQYLLQNIHSLKQEIIR